MLLYTAAVALVAAVWLGVVAYRACGAVLGVVSGAGAPLVLALWLASRGIVELGKFAMSDTTQHVASVAGFVTISACFLPKIYRDQRVGVDAFSVRAAVEGIILATAVVMLVLPLSIDLDFAMPDILLFSVLTLVAASTFCRTSRDDRGQRMRGLLSLILCLGAALVLVSPTGPLYFFAWGLVNTGLLGQAWRLQVHEPHVPSSHRIFEPEMVFPSLAMLGCWAAQVTWINKDITSKLTMYLAVWSMLLLAMRLAVSRWSEHTVLRQVRNLVYTDPLTGVGNRRALLERLARGPGWVMSLDLDSFKSINDQFGHEAGDVVLKRFAGRINSVLPPHADFFRIAGDEFAVVLPSNVRNIKALSAELVRCGSDPHHSEVSVSVGLAPFRSTDTPAGALRGSDIALQEAKRLGKNRAAVLDDSMLTDRMRELAIASRLRSGGLDDIYVVYQPLVAMGWQNRPLIGVEALARWTDRELGAVPPGEFVPVAERQGMIPELGLTVLRQALEQLRVWMNEGRPIQISVNVSVLQLRDAQVVAQMERLLAVEPELAKWIIIEVTETVFTDDDRAVNALRQLRSLGLCTALDDFGTGASTLTRLRHLPIDVLKIDRSLVSGAGTDPSADAILDMVATLGRRMEMVLVAEGLEEELATQRCAELGYAVGQGYVFSPPVPANMLPNFALLERPAMPRRPLVDDLWTQAAMAERGPGTDPRPQQQPPAPPTPIR